jgi:acyl-CoA thioesterase I
MRPFAVCALFFLLSSSTMHPPAIKILCIGDSITQGGKNSQKEYTYRLPLQKLLYENGISFDFIGSRKAGLHEDAIWPDITEGMPFDPDHEGYYGNKTAIVCEKVIQAYSEIGEIPDMVLVHLGTNDQKQGDFENNVALPLRGLIDFLRDKNPEVIIFLGHLNFNKGEPALQIRKFVESIAREKHTEVSPVITVHHYAGWREDPGDLYTDTFDWAHPNLKGQEKMAFKWLEAMLPFLTEKAK